MANLIVFLELPGDLDGTEAPTLHDVLSGQATATEATYAAPGGINVLPSGTSLDGFRAAYHVFFVKISSTVLRTRRWDWPRVSTVHHPNTEKAANNTNAQSEPIRPTVSTVYIPLFLSTIQVDIMH